MFSTACSWRPEEAEQEADPNLCNRPPLPTGASATAPQDPPLPPAHPRRSLAWHTLASVTKSLFSPPHWGCSLLQLDPRLPQEDHPRPAQQQGQVGKGSPHSRGSHEHKGKS